MNPTPSKLAAAALACLIASCATTPDPSLNPTRAAFFDEGWIEPSLATKPTYELYSEVMFTEVDTSRLAEMPWWSQQSDTIRAELKKDGAKVAADMRTGFENAVRRHPGNKFKVVRRQSTRTMVVDLALTELTPTNAFWNTGATAAGFAVPGAGLLKKFGAGSIEIEGRVRDGGSNRVIATFRDREKDAMAPASLKSYQWYAGSEHNIEVTAASFAELINSEPGTVIKDPAPIDLEVF